MQRGVSRVTGECQPLSFGGGFFFSSCRAWPCLSAVPPSSAADIDAFHRRLQSAITRALRSGGLNRRAVCWESKLCGAFSRPHQVICSALGTAPAKRPISRGGGLRSHSDSLISDAADLWPRDDTRGPWDRESRLPWCYQARTEGMTQCARFGGNAAVLMPGLHRTLARFATRSAQAHLLPPVLRPRPWPGRLAARGIGRPRTSADIPHTDGRIA